MIAAPTTSMNTYGGTKPASGVNAPPQGAFGSNRLTLRPAISPMAIGSKHPPARFWPELADNPKLAFENTAVRAKPTKAPARMETNPITAHKPVEIVQKSNCILVCYAECRRAAMAVDECSLD